MKLMTVGLTAVAVMVAAGCEVEQAESADTDPPEMEIINLPDALEGLPFSSAVRVGHTIYLSGQIGNIPGTRTLAAGGVAGETGQALKNINSVLAYVGTSRERIVKCTVFLEDIGDYAEMNGVYAEFFGENPPARSTVAGSGLALGAKVEIECIALTAA